MQTIKSIFVTTGLLCLLIYAIPIIVVICAINAWADHQQAKVTSEEWPSEL